MTEAHTTKSASENVGAAGLQQVVYQIEQSAGKESIEQLIKLVPKIADQLDLVKKEV